MIVWRRASLGIVVAALGACGPDVGHGEGGASGSGTSSSATGEGDAGSSTTGWSVEDVRPWFGQYRTVGGVIPPLDTRVLSLGQSVDNFDFRSDGTMIVEYWPCDAASPEEHVYAWTQTGRDEFVVDDWQLPFVIPPTEGSRLVFQLGEDCSTLRPLQESSLSLARGRGCWVMRNCIEQGTSWIEMTLCDGEASTQCTP